MVQLQKGTLGKVCTPVLGKQKEKEERNGKWGLRSTGIHAGEKDVVGGKKCSLARGVETSKVNSTGNLLKSWELLGGLGTTTLREKMQKGGTTVSKEGM